MFERGTDGQKKDDDSFYTVVYQWYAKCSAIAFGMIAPALAGLGIDQFFGTLPFGIIFGTIFGCVFGFYQLAKLVNSNLN